MMNKVNQIKNRLNAQTIEMTTIQQENGNVLVIDKCMCIGGYEVCLVYETDDDDDVGKVVITWKN